MHGHCMHSYILSQLFFAELTLFIRYQTCLNCLSLSYTNLAFCDIMLTCHYLILIDGLSCFYCLYYLLPTHCFEDWWLCICYCSKLMTCHFKIFKMMIWIDDKAFCLFIFDVVMFYVSGLITLCSFSFVLELSWLVQLRVEMFV